MSPNVDDLRARLRELGYLDAGVDRFVLAPAGRSRTRTGLAARASLRIGLVGALLLGPSTALAFAAWFPGLVVGPADVGVLALYLGALFGLATALAAFAAVLVAGALLGRAPAGAGVRVPYLARAAGLIVGLGALAYLALWWRAVGATGSAWAGSAGTIVVLALAAIASVLLGHAVTVTTMVAGAQGRPLTTGGLGRRSTSWRRRAAVALVAFGLGAAVLAVAAQFDVAPPAPESSPAIRAAIPGPRLTVLGLDGFDVAFAERLAAEGRLANLGPLLSGGAARVEFDAADVRDPAEAWTSIATGLPSGQHGVFGLEAHRVSGMRGQVTTGRSSLAATLAAATDVLRLTRPVAVSALERRAKTFWEVACEAGVPTAVVNWWATWPAASDQGVVLTDRATLRLERGGALSGEIAPPGLYADLQTDWTSLRQSASDRAVGAFPDRDDPIERALRLGAEQDAIQGALGRRVEPGAGLFVLYLPGLDLAQHTLLGGPGSAGLPPSVLAARVAALARYYEYLDGLLGAWLAPSDTAGAHVAILTDPGRAAARGRGLLAIRGPLLRPGFSTRGTLADVAPTLLFLMGVPHSRELPGEIRSDLFTDEAVAARRDAGEVSSYGRRLVTIPRGEGTPLDKEMMDRLRSLGYVR